MQERKVTIQDLATLVMSNQRALPGGIMLKFEEVDFSDPAQASSARSIMEFISNGLSEHAEEEDDLDDEYDGDLDDGDEIMDYDDDEFEDDDDYEDDDDDFEDSDYEDSDY